MSTAAIPAYVPRTGSLPPSSSDHHQPKRQAYYPRSVSHATNNNGSSSSSSSHAAVADDVRRSADAILKLLSGLPAPISGALGNTLLPVPRPATPSPPSASGYPSFKAFARAQKKRKAGSSGDESSSSATGLGLAVSHSTQSSVTGSSGAAAAAAVAAARPPLKKARTAHGHEGRERESAGGSSGAGSGSHELVRASSSSAGLTPPLRSAAVLPSPHRPARSSLRNEIKSGTADWTREQWSELYTSLGGRAHSLKRAGDAYLSPATAKGHLRGRVTEDSLRGVLSLTDSLCIYLYRNFAEERINGAHVKSKSYQQLEGLRQFVLGRWNTIKTDDEYKDMVKGMMGLIYLIEAITEYHVAMSDLRTLSRRGKELSASVSASGGSNVPASNTSAHGPSPASSSASPGGAAASRSPASERSEIPADLLRQLIAASTTSSAASLALQASRHHLSLRTLQQSFPTTWKLCADSPLSDDLLPAPGDTLGAARALDIDEPDVFAWPIEFGMQNAVAHVAVFGRALVREFSRMAGKPWEPVSTDGDSPR